MAMPTNIPIIDTMIGFPPKDFSHYDGMKSMMKDQQSKSSDFPVEYMFKGVPKDVYGHDDPIGETLRTMDKFGIEKAMIGLGTYEAELHEKALKVHPDRFIGDANVNPNRGVEGLRDMVRWVETFGIKAFTIMNSATMPPVPIDGALMYPIYAKCVELGLPLFACVGVPGPRLPMWPQEVARIDQVMYDFPELVYVMRHGAEPWEDLAIKLMVKWPNLYYCTSAFAPKHYPKAIIDYANSRGADKIIYAGYYPMGLSMERIMGDMQNVPFKDNVWPKFLRENARKVLKLG